MAAPLPDSTLFAPAAGAAAFTAERPRRRAYNLDIWIPAAILVIIFAGCFLWPLIGPVPPPVGGSILSAGAPMFSPGHFLGTDPVGNDIFSRILYGGQVSMEVALAVNAIGLVIGGGLGSIAGYAGGIVDAVIMRVIDVLIAFPFLVLALAISQGLGPNERDVIWALSFFSVPAFARISRAGTLRLHGQTFMLAARLSGTRPWRMLLRHVTPNVMPQVATFALLGMGVTVILEGALDFLGLGIPDPSPSWGNMIALGQGTLSAQPSLVVVPSVFLFVTVVALNLLGDALRARWGTQ
ncbi:MAG: ABC transporter permease [Nocardiopsaceae bacterium]|jgi:peptide/nickel transport system permease protein|nr:ABC transporter permease [Nocardiopsaceae bacterium]